MSPSIRFEDLWRAHGEQEVLRGLTFDVRPGEVYALLGRNGAGKTTAIRVLLGFLAADAGRCEVLGAPSERLTPALRDRVGYVSEDHALYPWMRVGEVLAFEHGTRRRFDLAYARSAAQRLGLGLGARVKELSRGARAQLALIAAVAARPEVLVMDDPAAGLDAVVRRELLETLIDAIGDAGCAVLLASHALSDVERVADRVGLLHGGRLVVDAPLDELKRRVERRRVRTRASLAPDVPGLLAARRLADGFDLLLLDLDAERERRLAGAVEALFPREALSLEELFLGLVGRRNGDASTTSTASTTEDTR